ncbi:MAG: fused MFS/spermidine synthase [Acidobacteria bacterium]|nr:fused MFS/spermidine synthase [Acidobacteriota bacterium]
MPLRTTIRAPVRDSAIPRPILAGILLCFFLSGAAGLIYQVAWGKALGLVFGNTVYAISTILAVFMGGLALGSAFLGRWSERFPDRVALYGWIELIIAASGALSLLGLAGVRHLYLAAYPLVSGFMPTLVALRFVGAAVVLLLPTFLMGGTLPILVSGLTRSSAELGGRVSRLYWVNTLGAVGGTFAAGFLFLPALGLRLTVALAVALNLLAGAIALLLARAVPPAAPSDDTAEATAVPTSSAAADSPAPIPVFLLASFALVGGTAIAYEVCWTRLLATTLGSSTYAFTLMLGTFLAGIVLGSALFEFWFSRRKEVSLATFAVTQTLTALAALLFLVCFQQFAELVPLILRKTQASFGGIILAQFATSALALLPAALVFGFNFPVVTVLIAGRPESSGHYAAAVGRAYAANTLGAILGATLAGFWLVPVVGAFRLVALLATLNFLLAAYLHARRAPAAIVKSVVNVVMVAAVIFVAFSGAFYDRALATFGAMLYYDRYSEKLTIPEIAATTDALFLADGLNATISVARTEDYIALRTNGKVDASNKDRITQLLVGHLGAIFHPAPRRVLVVGFGSGMTISALAGHPEIESITCVEIEPAVIRAADYLHPLNRNVLRDPRVHIVLDDARNFLLTTREQYDIIVSEPSNPWIAGVAALYTDEFYHEARSRLRPGGLFVQWVQAYSLYPEDFRMVLATFLPHFPQVTLWRGESPDYILVGQRDPGPFTLDRLREKWSHPALRADFDVMGLRRPEGIVGFHRLDDADLRKLAAGSIRNTDDRNRLEYRAPRGLLVKGLEDQNRDAIWKQRSAPLSSILRLDDPTVALEAAAETFVNLDDEDADFFIGYLENAAESAQLALLRGRWHLNGSRLDEAKQALTTALRLDLKSLDAADGLATVARRQGQYDTAELLCRQILARDPKYLPALRCMMRINRARENWDVAAEWQAGLLKLDPAPDADEFSRLGEVLMQGGKNDLAERAFFAALEKEPYSYAAHRNLGEIYLKKKLWDKAEPHFAFVVHFHPDADPGTYVGLAEVFRATGRPQSAVETLRKGLRIFPDSAEIQRLAPVTK